MTVVQADLTLRVTARLTHGCRLQITGVLALRSALSRLTIPSAISLLIVYPAPRWVSVAGAETRASATLELQVAPIPSNAWAAIGNGKNPNVLGKSKRKKNSCKTIVPTFPHAYNVLELLIAAGVVLVPSVLMES